MDKILTLSESAHYLRLAPITLYRLARRGKVPAVKLGRSWRFHQDHLNEWIRARGEAPHTIAQLPPAVSHPFRHLSTRETAAVLKFISLLRSRYPREVAEVILYGSRARGDFRADSDIDLLIILKNKGPVALPKEITPWAHHFSLHEDVRIQTLALSEEEWNHPTFKTFLLVEQIQREGIHLHE